LVYLQIDSWIAPKFDPTHPGQLYSLYHGKAVSERLKFKKIWLDLPA
jgi:hypothetical protein